MPSARRARRSTPKRTRAREHDLCRESWLAFLDTVLGHQPGPGLRIDGQRLSETQQRALHRWRQEGCSPSIFSADRFLTASGLHLSDYFIYCQISGLRSWALGVPPSWHDEDWWWEDAE